MSDIKGENFRIWKSASGGQVLKI